MYDYIPCNSSDSKCEKNVQNAARFRFNCCKMVKFVTQIFKMNKCASQWHFTTMIPPTSVDLMSVSLSSLLFPLKTKETREILHFHYTTWPDFGVPESPASFLNFLFKVRESGCLNSDQGPVVVHCSAGIGRSGTFCLVDTCLLLVGTKLCY